MECVELSDENKRKRQVEDLESEGGENVGGEYVGGETVDGENVDGEKVCGEDAARKQMLRTKDGVNAEWKTVESTSVKRRRKRRHMAIPADGYIWNKYGQKKITGTIHMRNYYRCALYKNFGCLCKKTISFDPQNPKNMSFKYIGEHNHNSVPVWGTIEDVSINLKNNSDAKFPFEKDSPIVKLENSLGFQSETDTHSPKKGKKSVEKEEILMGKEEISFKKDEGAMEKEGKSVEKDKLSVGKVGKPVENERISMGNEGKLIKNDKKMIEGEKCLKGIKFEEFQSADFEMKEGKENESNNLNMEDLEDLDMNLPMLPNGNEGGSFWSLEENNFLLTPFSGASQNDFFSAFETFPSIPTEREKISSKKENFLEILESLKVLELEREKKKKKTGKNSEFGDREKDLFSNVVSNLEDLISLMNSNTRSLQKNEISEGADESGFSEKLDVILRNQTENVPLTRFVNDSCRNFNNLVIPSLIPNSEKSSLSVEPNKGEELLTVAETSSCASMLAPDLEWTREVPGSQSYGSYRYAETGFPLDPISFLGGGDSLRVTDFMDHQLFLGEECSNNFM